MIFSESAICRAEDAEILLHVRGSFLEHHQQVVDRVGHDAERISQLVPDAARELAEHGELLTANERFLRVLKLVHAVSSSRVRSWTRFSSLLVESSTCCAMLLNDCARTPSSS